MRGFDYMQSHSNQPCGRLMAIKGPRDRQHKIKGIFLFHVPRLRTKQGPGNFIFPLGYFDQRKVKIPKTFHVMYHRMHWEAQEIATWYMYDIKEYKRLGLLGKSCCVNITVIPVAQIRWQGNFLPASEGTKHYSKTMFVWHEESWWLLRLERRRNQHNCHLEKKN